MYAIAFDLDTKALQTNYHNKSWRNAYVDLANALKPHGFTRQQGSVYFGDEKVTAVSCVIAVQAASNQLTWLKACVTDIRMLRIEEFNDLAPALHPVPVAGGLKAVK